MTDKETYLGDGLFASFDGRQIKLRAPREGGDHEAYLDGNMLLELIRQAQQWGIVATGEVEIGLTYGQTGGEP